MPPRTRKTTDATEPATPPADPSGVSTPDEAQTEMPPPPDGYATPSQDAASLANASLAGLLGDVKALGERLDAAESARTQEFGQVNAELTDAAKDINHVMSVLANENKAVSDSLDGLSARLDDVEAGALGLDGLDALRHRLDKLGADVLNNARSSASALDTFNQQLVLTQRELSTRGAITDAPSAILGSIRGIMTDVTGVGKHGQMDPAARMGNYKYQRYDDLKRELGTAFRAHGVFLQSTTRNLTTERLGEGGRLSRVVVSVTYRFTSLLDGSELEFDSHGESIDKSDKATGKAMTMALKTALTQAFMLAAEDTEDPDASRPGEEFIDTRGPNEGRPVEPHPTQGDVTAAQQVEREYAVGDQVTVAGQTFMKHSDGPALGPSGGPGYPNNAPKDPNDPHDQGAPPDTRTVQEQAQAAADAASKRDVTMARWSAISDHARQLGLYDVMVKVDGQDMALKHHLVAVGRTLA